MENIQCYWCWKQFDNSEEYEKHKAKCYSEVEKRREENKNPSEFS